MCGAKYKTRPGLTYHFTHTHKDAAGSDNDSRDSRPATSPAAAADYQDSYVTFLNNPTGSGEWVCGTRAATGGALVCRTALHGPGHKVDSRCRYI